jgi:4-amino-4-deoxy-L-arabinose transferase-like glycosyltransferase
MALHLKTYASNISFTHRFTPTLLSLTLLLYFWATGLTNLDRFPKVHEDEAWQAAPGYTFWTEGRFGTDLFAGFYGMEQHYYGFMPLFPILAGGGLRLFGLGLFQARLVPLALVLLTLALTHRLGSRLFSPWHGTLAVAILVTWRIAGPFAHLVSGIPLADVARITRYDSAVPVFGLAALLLLVTTADRRPRTAEIHHSPFAIRHSLFTIHNFFLIGLLAGLATLSHIYGAFWLPALLIATIWILGRQAVKPAILTAIGFGLALTPWLIFVTSGWTDFLAQTRNYADRFGVLDSRFYFINLLNEVERYDPILNGAKQSLGAWLWLILSSLSLIWLLKLSLVGPIHHSSLSSVPRPRSSVISARILISVLATLSSLFALLLSFKTFSYLATLWPLFALAMAAGFSHVWQAETTYRWWRLALLFLFLLAMTEGIHFNARLHTVVQQMTPYQSFTQAVVAKLPPESRVMGLQHYWLGLAGNCQNYRSILAPIFWTDPRYVPEPISFAEAVEVVSPQIVLLDQIMLDFLAETSAPDHPWHRLGQEIKAYLAQRQAQRIGQVDDPTYGRMQIYQLAADR